MPAGRKAAEPRPCMARQTVRTVASRLKPQAMDQTSSQVWPARKTALPP